MGIGHWVLSGAAMLLMAACSPQTATDSQATGASAASEQTVHPESGLEIVPVTISMTSETESLNAGVAASLLIYERQRSD